MIKYGTPQEIEEYFADSSVNQSYLKQLIKGVDHLEKKEQELYYEEKGHFLIGGAVDVYITQGAENFNEQYYISTGKKPSDAIMSIVKMVFDDNVSDGEPSQSPLEDFEGDVLSSLDYHKYQSRWKTETRIAKVIEEGATYFSELAESYGKVILSHSQYQLISNIIMSVKTGKYTAEYFKDSPTVDIYYQVPIYFTYNGLPCKALLDMLRVYKNTKVVEPIDIKTMSGFTAQFPKSVKSFGYNFQGAFYTQALVSLLNGEAKCDKIKEDLREYSIAPFKFIVETTHTKENKTTGEVSYYTGKPLVYQLGEEQMKLGKFGRPEIKIIGSNRELASDNTFKEHDKVRLWEIPYQPIIGFEEAINLHRWYTDHGFHEDYHVAESGGIITIE